MMYYYVSPSVKIMFQVRKTNREFYLIERSHRLRFENYINMIILTIKWVKNKRKRYLHRKIVSHSKEASKKEIIIYSF